MEKFFIVNFFKDIKDLDKQDNIGGTKFDRDLITIFAELGFILKIFPTTSKISKIKTFFKIIYELLISKKSIYFFRYPLIYLGSKLNFINILYARVIYKIMNLSEHKIAVIISDLDFVRYRNNVDEEIELLSNFDYIIAHNKRMMNFLEKNGINREKLIDMEMGNNLTKKSFFEERKLSKVVVFSGNLFKSTFLNKLSENDNLPYILNVYGKRNLNLKENNFIRYKGYFTTEEILNAMEGSWGLAWDGPDIDRCTGPFCNFDYLKIINPSKFSLYIAAGLPVIAWNKAAISEIVEEYNIGFTINNLNELGIKLERITENQYKEYIKNVMNLRRKIIDGYYLKKAINKIIILSKE